MSLLDLDFIQNNIDIIRPLLYGLFILIVTTLFIEFIFIRRDKISDYSLKVIDFVWVLVASIGILISMFSVGEARFQIDIDERNQKIMNLRSDNARTISKLAKECKIGSSPQELQWYIDAFGSSEMKTTKSNSCTEVNEFAKVALSILNSGIYSAPAESMSTYEFRSFLGRYSLFVYADRVDERIETVEDLYLADIFNRISRLNELKEKTSEDVRRLAFMRNVVSSIDPTYWMYLLIFAAGLRLTKSRSEMRSSFIKSRSNEVSSKKIRPDNSSRDVDIIIYIILFLMVVSAIVIANHNKSYVFIDDGGGII